MSGHPLGAAFPLTATITDATGALADPAGLTYTQHEDGVLTPTVVVWNPSGPVTELVRLGLGSFQIVVDADLAPAIGHYRWLIAAAGPDGTVLPVTTGVFDITDPAAYPFPYGYCDFPDVANRIVGGTWNMYAADTTITPLQVGAFIEESTAEIDMVLVKRGYYVPLEAQAGKTIAPTVWTHLRGICGQLAAGRVELARHGSATLNADNVGKTLIALARAQLSRIETGEDNLTIFGVDGAFEPSADPGAGMSDGTLLDLAGNPVPPLFTVSGPIPDIGFPQDTGLLPGSPNF